MAEKAIYVCDLCGREYHALKVVYVTGVNNG